MTFEEWAETQEGIDATIRGERGDVMFAMRAAWEAGYSRGRTDEALEPQD